MFGFLRKKKNQLPAPVAEIDYAALKYAVQKDDGFFISEPWTLAQARLEGGAKDKGAASGLKLYNAHKTKLQNQWVNPLQSVNSGWGNTHLSFFLYQPVNYYECYSLAQDPLFTKVFNLLSITPFAKGGEIVFDNADETQQNIEKDKLEKLAKEYDVWEHIQAAVHSNYVTGGCLLYMDFGQTESELREPLNLNKMSMKKFKGFRHIDPINCVAVNVNTVDPAAADYMKPKTWYVIGLGTVDESHFLKFEENLPELPMRPLTLYFGMPLTQLIKQDVANSNLASQGLANLMNRFRYVYLKTEESNFVTANVGQFREKLDFMSFSQDNFGVCPLKSTEEVLQLTTSLTGMAENVELFYLLVAAKTDIPYTELVGKSAQGMNATGEGDRRKWYDKCRSIQSNVKNNLLTMYGIIAGIEGGRFIAFADYIFNPLEESNERERAENIRSYAEVAQKLVELGAKTDKVFEWLKSFKDFHLDNLEFDTETAGLEAYDDITDEVMSEFQAQNEWEESKHPRAKDGKFGSGGGSSEQKEDTDRKISDFLGKEFTGVKGQAAIDKLMQERQGHVKGAFTRKDIGDIDLVWGNEGMGLAHIIKRRKETGQNLRALLSSLTDVVEKGDLSFAKERRFEINHKGKKAIIEPKLYGKNIQFVFTAYYDD